MVILYMAGLIFAASFGFGFLCNLVGFDEREVLGFIFASILMIGGTVAYGLNEVQLELEKMRGSKS